MDYREKVKEITRRFLDGKTMEQFAFDLRIPGMSRQTVWTWKSGARVPSAETLLRVIDSPRAASWAKEWAGECLAALRQPEPELSIPSPDISLQEALEKGG